jgi:hypothetical protein
MYFVAAIRGKILKGDTVFIEAHFGDAIAICMALNMAYIFEMIYFNFLTRFVVTFTNALLLTCRNYCCDRTSRSTLQLVIVTLWNDGPSEWHRWCELGELIDSLTPVKVRSGWTRLSEASLEVEKSRERKWGNGTNRKVEKGEASFRKVKEWQASSRNVTDKIKGIRRIGRSSQAKERRGTNGEKSRKKSGECRNESNQWPGW